MNNPVETTDSAAGMVVDRSIAREAAKNKVIASGNAQAVYRRLREIEEGRTANLNRWVWELLQNARDAAGTNGTVSVSVMFDGTTLTFRHDGPPFRDEEIAHLIFHGSTKHDEHAGIGRFGTGFISTHLLSRVVRIRGPLDDGTVFEFDLDRTGDDASALERSMDRSWQAMNGSIRPANGSEADRNTEFEYSIGSNTESVVLHGLTELGRVAPLVLAFNPKFSSLSVDTDGRSVTYRVHERQEPASEAYKLRIVDGSDCEVSTVIVIQYEDVQVAIGVTADVAVKSILPCSNMSRVFVAFPLMKTANFPLRAAMNSELFHPRTERDGIYLETDGSPQNVENRRRFKRGCEAFGPLMEYATRSGLPGLLELLVLTLPANLESVNVEWLTATIKTSVVNDLTERRVFTTRDGSLVAPRDAVIPLADAGKRRPLWKLCAAMKDLAPYVSPEEDVDGWNDVMTSWSHFTAQPPEKRDEVWTLEDIVSSTGEERTISKLAARIQEDVWGWLSLLLNTMRDDDVHLAQKYAIIPNQKGEMKKCGELFLDDAISDELKNLAEAVGLPGRASLLANELSGCCYAPDLDPQSSEDVIEAIIDEIGDLEDRHRAVAIRLFGFVVNHRFKHWLGRIPVVTASEILGITTIAPGASPRHRLLLPVARWADAKEFGGLFPVEFVMHDDYVTVLAEDDWKWLVEQGAVIASPLVTDSAQVEDFVAVMRTETEQPGSVRSKEKVSRSHIAYLVGETSVLERIRNSRRSGTLLIRFLIEFVVPRDTIAFSKIEVECEDGDRRACYGAAWIAQLLSRGWVKGEKRPSHLTAESLADLLSDQPDIIKLLLDDKHAPLLQSLDLSAADLAFRSVGKTETDRMSLIRSLGVIANAVGNDPAIVARFAATIQSDTKLLEYIEQRSTFIERMERNQSFGFAVEREFKAVFGEGLGVRITRTGHGHDFVLNPIAGEEDDAGRVEIATADQHAFVELKATRGSDAVYMSVRQVQAATEMKDRYWLCVVVIEEGDATSDLVRVNARFICEIGSRLEEAWAQYEDLRDATPALADFHGETALEVSGQEIRFRIGHKLWASGVSFEEAMKRLRASVGDSRPVTAADGSP